MNFSGKIIDLVLLFYAGSEAIIVINDKRGEGFKTKGGVRQGCLLIPYLFIIVLELMGIEIREDKQIKGVDILTPHKKISSYSHMNKQHDNKDDILSMFADDISTITTSADQVLYARENIHTY